MIPTLRLFIFLFFGVSSALPVDNVPRSFHPSSMDMMSDVAGYFAKNYTHEMANDPVLSQFYDSFLLPSRAAVERVPTLDERAEEHYPIRDAVEKRPPIDQYLEYFRSHILRTQNGLEEENPYRVVCFVNNWAYYRKADNKFTPEYVDPKLCTHVVYAYASLNPENYSIAISDPFTDIERGFYKKITSKEISTEAKVLISVGGWTDSADEKYSKLVNLEENRLKFVDSVIKFLERYKFSGLHFDWDYPVCWQARCTQAHASDKTNFVKLIKKLYQEFGKHNPKYELAISVSGYKEIIDVSYDVMNLSENVDFMTVMTYDYHGAWENHTGHLSPLYSKQNDQFPDYSTHSTMSNLVLLGADPKKLVMGLPFYGQSFTLANSEHHDMGDETVEPGKPGEYTQQPGILSYREICVRVKNRSWMVDRNPETETDVYAYGENQWVGFDDKLSLRKKVQYMKRSGYGGVMVWTLDTDDYNNECCTGVYPLLREVNAAIGRISSQDTKPDCTKPIIVPLFNDTELTTITEVPADETTEPMYSSSTSTWPWAPTHQTPNISEATSIWWPPTLTSRPTMSHPSTQTDSTTTTTVTPSTTTIASTSASSEPSADECVSGTYSTDITNCGAYFICEYGKRKKYHCAIGLHWNFKTQTCDWPAKANCYDNFADAQATESTTQSSSTRPTTSFTRPAVACTNGEHYAVPGDCSAFYTCVGGRLSKRRCPTNTKWNQQIKLCDWKSDSQGCDDSNFSTTEFQTTPTTTKSPSIEKGTLKNECSKESPQAYSVKCIKYYQCLQNMYNELKCTPALMGNKEVLICNKPNSTNCEQIFSSETEQSESFNTSTSAIASTHSSTTASLPTSTIPWWSWSESTSPTTVWWTSSTTQSSSNTPWWTQPTTPSTTNTPWWTQSSSQSTTNTPWWMPSSTQTTSKPSSEISTSWTSSSVTSWDTWTPSTTTAATLPTTKPSYSLKDSAGQYKLVCYFTNWAWYRPGPGKYIPEDTDTNLCTHIVYGFIVLDGDQFTVRIHDSWADVDNKFFERVAALKQRGVKVTVAIGGWNDSAGDKYSRLVNNPTARANFISSVLRFINKYGFDGLDLDWEYPKCWQTNCNKGPDSDKDAFSALVTELRESFDRHGYLLSAAVSPSKQIIDLGYNVPLLSEKLDWIAVMTYDFHGQWDKKTGHVAPIYYIPGDDKDYFNTYYAINYWIEKGANSRKLVMGMPMYGQGFTLSNAAEHDLNAPSAGPSNAGEYTRSNGFLAYYEICQKIQREQWTVVQDPQGRRGPYAYKGDQWVGFDDINSITTKVNLIKKLNLGGGMIWALDLDDFRNTCGDGHYPLLTTIAKGLAQSSQGTYKQITRPSPSYYGKRP